MTGTKRPDILGGDIKKVLIRLTIPMILGVLGMVAFNLTDTYFVSRLGTLEMAAISFTFPVVLIINSLIMGVGVGTSAAISNAVGRKDDEQVKRLATDSLLLGLSIAVIAVTAGELTIKPLFRLLGADDQVMPYLVKYMRVWYGASLFLAIPMVGNNAIRALGDTKTPSIVMLIAAGVNIALDPLLIFGIGRFEGFGIMGAALATVTSRFITFLVAVYILFFREKAVKFKGLHWKEVMQSWKTILFVGIPNALSKMVLPVGTGIITGLIATQGNAAVAGYGIATKSEFMFFSIFMALASVIPIFVGQNFGAKQIERIHKGILMSERFTLLYGLGVAVILFFAARPIAGLFSDNDQVVDVVVTYLRIVPISYGLFGVMQLLNSSYNALRKPIKASLINLTQVLAVFVPLAALTAKAWGIYGIFGALAASYIVVGIGFHLIWRRDRSKLV